MEDCEQYVYYELIKLYPKRYRYKNWKAIVRTTIDRKIVDFSKRYNSSTRAITEADLHTSLAGNSEDIIDSYVDLAVQRDDLQLDATKIVEAVSTVINVVIDNPDKFNEWDFRYIKLLLDDTKTNGIPDALMIIKDAKLKGMTSVPNRERLRLFRRKVENLLK